MARPKSKREIKRSDTGTKRGSYKNNLDTTGKVGKENIVLNNFWKLNKVADFMTLSEAEADKVIDAWMEDFEKRNIKRNSSWWYPSITIPIAKARNKRTDLDKKPRI